MTVRVGVRGGKGSGPHKATGAGKALVTKAKTNFNHGRARHWSREMPFDPGYFYERQRKRHAEGLAVRIGGMAWHDMDGERAAHGWAQSRRQRGVT